MPTLWRYILKQFFKVFALTTLSFIFVLFATRLKEIAKIMAMTPKYKYVFLFMLNIVPFILPIAVPIACLIAAFLLYQKLSVSHELTAMRCSGFSLFSLIFPTLAAATCLSFANFYIISEVTTQSKVFSKKLMNQLITDNPFYLLEHRNRLKIRNFYFDMLVEERGKQAKDLVFISPDKSQRHLNLVFIKDLEITDNQIYAPSINIVSNIQSKSPYSHLVLENEKNFKANASDLSQLVKNSSSRLSNECFSMPSLLLKAKSLKSQISQTKDSRLRKVFSKKLTKIYSQIGRRISTGISAFTFTFLAISFAIEISRNRKKRNLLIMSSLTIFSLLCLFTGSIFDKNLLLSSLIYFMPHILILVLSGRELSKIAKGIE
ncbi:MAG: hypothetical protein S4CHLAM7_01450 [Chlamydiae bacterium]|nr:hypothetical protein [Chlamydiota bacterium]